MCLLYFFTYGISRQKCVGNENPQSKQAIPSGVAYFCYSIHTYSANHVHYDGLDDAARHSVAVPHTAYCPCEKYLDKVGCRYADTHSL